MQVLFLYAAVVMIWGSTWAAIPFQFGVVAAEVSVGYRFGIAAVLLYGYALISGRQIRLPANAYGFVLLQGTLLFCLNYLLVYYATARITSGLVAVVFSSIVLFNAINERIFFNTRIDGRLVIAGLLGLGGIAMIFWPEVSVLSFGDNTIVGMSLVLLGTILASFGNMTAVINTRHELPVIAVNAHAMAWSALLSSLIAAWLGREFNFSMQPGYIISLAYLAVFGSAIAFGCYLALIRRIGSARAAYSSVLFPVVALAISTVVEGYRWTAIAALGIMLTLAGNWLILRSKTT
ncbi:MAG: EamA family transporter [Gammaproteobacteria bacterium]|nr:EamA family transporter [Gammaproteobacteria bacterium]MDH3408766.1 EamA family transporter [Gammaproteobacteria bacterium]MDH3552083.1 EamA family transporter [Gammaproteobacteria bacterium]